MPTDQTATRGALMTVSGASIGLGKLPFNLHIRDSSGRLVLYGRRGVEITRDLQESINRTERVFYITHDDFASYLDYIMDNVERMVRDPDIGIEVKTSVIQDAGRKIHRKIVSEKLDARTVNQSSRLAKSVVNLILGSPEAYQGLLNMTTVDNYLYEHALNCCTFAVMIGMDLYGEDDVKLFILGMGGLLMDIGMASVDRSIVMKSGKLSDFEFARVKDHTNAGFELLREHEMPVEVMEMARWHHERLDGTGYPDGIKWGQIPEHVHIAAVADVYDALTSVRPHRKEYTHISALEIMLRNRERFSIPVLEALMRVTLQNEQLIEALKKRHAS